MADDEKKTYTADEHLAILSDRVTKETASLTEQVGTVTTERDELATKLDVAESGKTAAEQERDAAVKELADYKAEVEQREAAAERKDDRLKTLREAAAHLGDDWFDEADPESASAKRVKRIVAMSDEDFEAFKSDIGASAPNVAPSGSAVPRETAMAGRTSTTKTESSARSFLMRGSGLVGAGASTKEN